MNDMKKNTPQPECAGDVGSTRLVRCLEEILTEVLRVLRSQSSFLAHSAKETRLRRAESEAPLLVVSFAVPWPTPSNSMARPSERAGKKDNSHPPKRSSGAVSRFLTRELGIPQKARREFGGACSSNVKLTDDEERANDARIGTRG